MKKALIALISASLLVGSIGSAQADWGHHRGYYGPPAPMHRHGGDRWIGPAAILALTGLAVGAAAYSNNVYATPAPAPVYTPPAPVYVAPPAPLPANQLWYYCQSSSQYYPYTNACPEGWIAVPAR